MRINKCKSFIRSAASSSSASIDRLPIIQSQFTYSENTVNPLIWPSSYLYLYFPGRAGFVNNIGRPPFACNDFLTRSRNQGVSQFVGFNNFCTARPLSADSIPQKHTTDREIPGQNRYRDISIDMDNNQKFLFIPIWVRWLFGSVMTFWGGHMISDLLKIEGDVEKVVEIVEDTAEMVEKLATMTEKISNAIAEEFPEDGAINKTAHFVEHLSEEVIEDAHNTQEFIHKITSTEKIVETSIETIVEALEELINAKPTISSSDSHSDSHCDDQVTDTHTEKNKSKSESK